MANVVFIQRLWYEYPGTGYLSAILRKHGHSTRVIIEESPRRIVKRLLPGDIAAFSVMTGMHHWALGIASHIKKTLGLMTVFGGPHPTYFPDVIEKDAADIICRGEGEYALLDLANAIDNERDFDKIANLWVKSAGTIHKNPLRPLIDDLDTLPLQDRQ
ncbi:MAG TPA: cobalamin-dependent protein, partial [Syntrophales bacterium]|nr:cobalamin-dependent protein [Syntrophales bacterium]